MPLYDYRCNDCDNVFTELRSMAQKDDPISCPECGQMTQSREINQIAIGGKSAKATSPSSCGSRGFS
ncbi:MAG: zinc ribbon domain-containing protein [SAR324 cluster bacterium]|nr:zinc ribbon domain-containing protein [SAR324 cluster bacterium]